MHPSMKKAASKKLHQEQSYSFKTAMCHSRKHLQKKWLKYLTTRSDPSLSQKTRNGDYKMLNILRLLTTNIILLQKKKRWQCQGIGFLSAIVMKFQNDKLIVVYADLLTERDNNLSGMMVLLEIMIIISASTAACKRGLSCMNRQKINIRTNLSQLSLHVLRICINDCDSMLKRISSIGWISQMESDTFKDTKAHLKKERIEMVKLLAFRVRMEHFILFWNF